MHSLSGGVKQTIYMRYLKPVKPLYAQCTSEHIQHHEMYSTPAPICLHLDIPIHRKIRVLRYIYFLALVPGVDIGHYSRLFQNFALKTNIHCELCCYPQVNT
uniref:Uncharacterized protein n=1 Tax=Glossina palpalis gambiensis TaxID=67801 RepID=A0A1B0BPF3_9MUSC